MCSPIKLDIQFAILYHSPIKRGFDRRDYLLELSRTIWGKAIAKSGSIPLDTYSSVNQCATGRTVSNTSAVLTDLGKIRHSMCDSLEKLADPFRRYSKHRTTPFHAKKATCAPK
jgi:hypothetical protein